MLVISPNGDTKTVCYHPHAVLQNGCALCPDCEQTFSKRTKAYKEIANREPSQTRTPTRSPIGVSSSNPSDLRGPGRSNQKRRRRGSPNPTGVDCERTDQTSERTLSGITASGTKVNGDSWNTSSEGLNFWKRVELVWPYLSQEEQHHVYFTKAVDYPRPPEMLETIEARRQLPVELPKTQRTVTPQGAEGNELKVGDRVNFQHYWDGDYRQQEAIITEIEPHGIKGVLMLRFDTGNAELLGEVQIPIQQVALSKSESGQFPSEVSTNDDKDFSVGDKVKIIKGCCAGQVSVVIKIDLTLKHCIQLADAGRYEPKFLELLPPDEPSEFADLEAERDRLIKAAEFAPENGWIETGKVSGKDFRQAWWRGKFSGGKKTIYIGRVGSPEYGKAKNAQQARKQLKKITRQIEHLKKQSNLVSGKR